MSENGVLAEAEWHCVAKGSFPYLGKAEGVVLVEQIHGGVRSRALGRTGGEGKSRGGGGSEVSRRSKEQENDSECS